MFAVIKTGGKQYRVAAEDVIEIEKLSAEAGATVTFEEVLLVGDGEKSTVGAPLVAGASVAGEVVEQTRGDKVRIFKKKRRKGYRRTAGHRQHLTVVKITDILTDGAKKAAKKATKAPAKATDAKAAEDKKPAKATAKKVDAPKADAPKAEAPKADAPKAETKKAEPKAEPKSEAKPKAKTEETKPAKADKE